MKPKTTRDAFVDLSRALAQLGKAIVIFWREVYRADEETVEAMKTLAKFPANRLIAKVGAGEMEAVMQRLHRLRVLCEVNELDFGEITQFAIDVHDGGDRSWTQTLDASITEVENVEKNRRDWNRFVRSIDDSLAADTEPEVLDAPNDRLPKLFRRR
jgi:hypothetical protein